MSEDEFERTMTTDRIPRIKLSDINIIILTEKQKLTHIIKVYPQLNKFVKIKDVKSDDILLPIFLTQEKLYRGGDKVLKHTYVRPWLNEDLMSVFLGKYKLFTFPFWKCHQFDNIHCKNKITLDGVSFDFISRNRRIENFINRKLSPVSDRCVEINKYINIKTYVLTEIKKHKIYDIDFSNLIPNPNKDILEVFKCEPLLRKTYEYKNMNPETAYVKNIPEIDINKVFNIVKKSDISFENLEEDIKPTNIEDYLKSNAKKHINVITNDINLSSLIEDDDDDFFNDQIDDYFEKSFKNTKENQDSINIINFNKMEETLANSSQQYDYVGDFLIEDDTFNLDEDMMDLIDEIDQPRHMSEKELSFGVPSISFEDIFILKPERQKPLTKKEGIGYMLTRLRNLESLFILQLLYKYDMTTKNRTMNLSSFILELRQLNNLLNKCDRSDYEVIYLLLYILLCKTFLKPNNEINEKQFFVNDREIFCVKNILKKDDNVTRKQIEQLNARKLIHSLKSLKDNILCFSVIITIEKQLELFGYDVLKNYDSRHDMDLSDKAKKIYFDICQKYEDKTKDDDLIDDLLI